MPTSTYTFSGAKLDASLWTDIFSPQVGFGQDTVRFTGAPTSSALSSSIRGLAPQRPPTAWNGGFGKLTSNRPPGATSAREWVDTSGLAGRGTLARTAGAASSANGPAEASTRPAQKT